MRNSAAALDHARFDSICVGGRALFRYLAQSIAVADSEVSGRDMKALGRVALADATARCADRFGEGSPLRVGKGVVPEVTCQRRLGVAGPVYTVDVEIRACLSLGSYEIEPFPVTAQHITADTGETPDWGRLLMLAQDVGGADIFDPNAVTDFVSESGHPESGLWIRRMLPFRDSPEKWAVFISSYVFNIMTPANRSALKV